MIRQHGPSDQVGTRSHADPIAEFRLPASDHTKTTIAAADVPALRREIAEWTTTRGADNYTEMIHIGKQVVRPPGPPEQVGRWLADEEVKRLANGDLWYLDAGLCALLESAHATMPRFAPRQHDLPSQSGFAVFAQPIAKRSPRDELQLAAYVEKLALGQDVDHLASLPVEIGAVSWGPLSISTPQAPAGAVWMSFYACTRVGEISDETVRRAATAILPPMLVDNEAVVPWIPDGADDAGWMLPDPEPHDAIGTWGWAAMVFAAFRLATQAGLVDRATERTPRPERRRTQRAGLPGRDVHTVRLRHATHPGGGAGDAGREYSCRWVVRGHWRNQPWGPNRSLRRPTWVLPHVKGPDGAPLRGGERVNVATAPTTSEGDQREARAPRSVGEP
jgi:hypothetical protein